MQNRISHHTTREAATSQSVNTLSPAALILPKTVV